MIGKTRIFTAERQRRGEKQSLSRIVADERGFRKENSRLSCSLIFLCNFSCLLCSYIYTYCSDIRSKHGGEEGQIGKDAPFSLRKTMHQTQKGGCWNSLSCSRFFLSHHFYRSEEHTSELQSL